MLKPIQRPSIPPELATNQITGIFWSRLQHFIINDIYLMLQQIKYSERYVEYGC